MQQGLTLGESSTEAIGGSARKADSRGEWNPHSFLVRIPVCPAWALTCCLQSNDRRLWSQPKQNSEGVTARERPEEGECAALTAGTRTGSEAGSRAVSQLGLVKPNSTRRTRAVEPGGMKRRSMFLPGEIWTVRAVQKSGVIEALLAE
jgi:hypothetical protein